MSLSNSEEPLKEALQLFYDSALFLCAVSASEAGGRRHQFINIGAGCLDLPVAEGVIDKFARLALVQPFIGNDGGKLFFLFLRHIAVPFGQHVLHIVDAGNEGLDQRLFTAQLGAGVNGFLNRNQNFLVCTVRVMIFLDKQKNVINIDLNLTNQLDFKHHVVSDVLFLPVAPPLAPFVAQILIPPEVVLQVPLGQQLFPRKLVERRKQIAHPKDRPKKRDKMLLILFSLHARLGKRKVGFQLRYHFHIAGVRLMRRIDIAVIIVVKLAHQDNAACIFIAEQRNGGVHPFLQVAETDDVAKGLDTVQNSVGAAECLNQPVHPQVFVNPQRVERGCVKSGQEHIDHDQKVKLLVLHPQGNVLVIALESVAVGGIVGVEHLIIVADGAFEKIAAACVKRGGVLRVFLVQKVAVGVGFVGGIAENGGNAQFLGRVCGHLPLEFVVIELCHWHRRDRKHGIEARKPLLLLDLIHSPASGGRDLGNVGQRVVNISLVTAVGLLIEMVKNILGHKLNPLGRHICPLAVDVVNILIHHLLVNVHRFDVIHAERQDVVVINRVHNGVGVQLVAKGLLGREKLRGVRLLRVDREDRRSGKAEQMVLAEILHNRRVHIAELRAMAFVKDDDNVLLIDRMTWIFLDKGCQLLNGRNDNMAVLVLKLFFEDCRAGVGVCRTLFKTVVFLHGLIVEVFAVHDKQDLVDIGQCRGKPRGLEGGQRFAASCGVPDVTAARDAAVFLIIVCNFNAVENPLGCRNLIRTHDEKQIFGGENAIARQDVENRMAGEKGLGKVDEVGNDTVVCICPVGGKFKAVACFALLAGGGSGIFHGVKTSTVGIVFRVCAVGDDENLHIFKQPRTGIEGVALIAVDLVERLADGNAAALQLDVDKRKPVDEHGHIIAVVVLCAVVFGDNILIGDLQAVVVDVLFVNQRNIFRTSVIAPQDLHIVLLHFAGLFRNAVVGIGNALGKEPLPFAVGKAVVVQHFQLCAQVGDQLRLAMNRLVLIALLCQKADKLRFERSFALIGVGTNLGGFIFGDHRVFSGCGNDVEV